MVPTSLRTALAGIEAMGTLAPALATVAGQDRLWLVGGAVRDLLLGIGARAGDLDVVVEGDAPGVAARLARALDGSVCVHAAFATAVVSAGPLRIDLATARSERYATPGALPAVEPADLRVDLARRDFACNAMALSLGGAGFGRLIDPFGGEGDVAARRLRVLHSRSFVDDPTRILRGARYEARLGFRLDAQAEALARAPALRDALALVSGPRLRDALVLVCSEPAAATALARLEELGVLRALEPALSGGAETVRLIGRFDALCAASGGEVRWRGRLGIAARGFEPSGLAAWLAALRLRRRDADAVVACALEAPRLAAALATAPDGSVIAGLLEPVPADVALVAAAVGDARAEAAVARYTQTLRHVRLAITGDDLQAELGLVPGPELGRVLIELRAAKLRGELADRGAELAAARALTS